MTEKRCLTTALNRSYAAEKMYPVGSWVSVNEVIKRNVPIDTRGEKWEWQPVTLNPGESFRVLDYSNAGFRGIEAALENEDGLRISGISAGYLIAPFEAH